MLESIYWIVTIDFVCNIMLRNYSRFHRCSLGQELKSEREINGPLPTYMQRLKDDWYIIYNRDSKQFIC